MMRRVTVYDHEYPVALEQNRFATKKINAPQAVLHVTEKSQPRGASAAGLLMVVHGKYTVHDVLVYRNAKRLRDYKGDARAPKVWISAFQFDNSMNQLF
jgi:hypothetical protein